MVFFDIIFAHVDLPDYFKPFKAIIDIFIIYMLEDF